MNFYQTQAYAGFWGGATAMISLHNTVVSLALYKSRKTNVSNILKIIFNFSNFVRFTSVVGLYLVPENPTIEQCTSLQYLAQIGNVFVRVSLSAFLLWRLRQLNNNRIDNVISLILLLLRAGFGLIPLAYQRPTTVTLSEYGITICSPNQTTNRDFTFIVIVIDAIIDFYVSIRLFQLLRDANKNTAQTSSNMGNKTKRSLFTAIMYWNFLRLFVSLVFQISPFLFYLIDDEVRTITLQSSVNICLSYVITVDAEIVRVIKDDEEKGSSIGDSEKSSKSMSSQRSRTPLPQNYSGHSPKDLLKYSPQDSSFNDKDKIVVSMKNLSFFEWANVVSGKRFYAVNDEGELEEAIEDDIEKGPQNQDSDYVEKGPAPNRDDTCSESTLTETSTETSTTLDGNLDSYNS